MCIRDSLNAMCERFDGRLNAMSERFDGRLNTLGERFDGRFATVTAKLDALTVALGRFPTKLQLALWTSGVLTIALGTSLGISAALLRLNGASIAGEFLEALQGK